MYLLDANAFMEASRLYYSFDIAPGFWNWLGRPVLEDDVPSGEAVKDENTSGTGSLVQWAEAMRPSFWLPDTADTVSAMARLSSWAVAPERQYTQAAVNEFMSSADLRLIAHAIVLDATVVTREQPAPDAKKVIKIPDVCNAFGVTCTDPFAAYRKLGLRLAA